MQDPGFVKRAFTDIADRYVLTNHVLSLGTDILWRRKLGGMIEKLEPKEVLDIATGSGDVAAEIAKRCPDAEILGVDFCQPMLLHARKRGLSKLVVADGLRLPFADESFDVTTVAFGLRNMASWKDGLMEMARTLKPGGTLYVLDFSQPTWRLLRGPYLFYLHRVLPKVAGLLTKQRQAYEYLSSSIDQFPHGSAMCELIEETGFASAKSVPLSFGRASIYVAKRSSN